MTDAEIAQELDQVFAEMPGMRGCYLTWRGIEERLFITDGVDPPSEAKLQMAFYRLLQRTERRVQAFQAEAKAEGAVPDIIDLPRRVQVSIPPSQP